MITVVIPVFNEEANLPLLIERLFPVLDQLDRPFEVIFVNDGSIDRSMHVLRDIARARPQVKVIGLARNYGQTAAMVAGFDHADGEVIVPMDADLQNDPADIPVLLAKLDEGFDVVSGWRKERKDQPLRRNLLSRIANALISLISGVRLHDYGCSMKAYRRSILGPVRLYGEMHRFMPIYASWYGARITEVVVRHEPRQHGQSNYGLERVFKVIMDLLVVQFLERSLGQADLPVRWVRPALAVRIICHPAIRDLPENLRECVHDFDATSDFGRNVLHDGYHEHPARTDRGTRDTRLFRMPGQADLSRP